MNPKLLKIIDRYAGTWLSLAVLVLLGAIAISMVGGIMYYSGATTETVETQTDRLSSDLSFSSEVEEDTRLFSEGDVLHNSPLYIYSTNPELTVRQEMDVSDETMVESTVWVQYSGMENGWEFWEERDVIDSKRTTVDSDNGVDFQATIDIIEVHHRATEIRDEFDDEGHVSVDIVVESTYATDEYSGELQDSSQLLFRDHTYALEPPQVEMQSNHEVERTVIERRSEHDPYFRTSGVLLVIGALFALAHLMANPRRTQNDYERMKYGDWVTKADSISLDEYENIVTVSSMSGLVDIAIDSHTRALWVPEREVYAVFDGDFAYLYDAKESKETVVEDNDKPADSDTFGELPEE